MTLGAWGSQRPRQVLTEGDRDKWTRAAGREEGGGAAGRGCGASRSWKTGDTGLPGPRGGTAGPAWASAPGAPSRTPELQKRQRINPWCPALSPWRFAMEGGGSWFRAPGARGGGAVGRAVAETLAETAEYQPQACHSWRPLPPHCLPRGSRPRLWQVRRPRGSPVALPAAPATAVTRHPGCRGRSGRALSPLFAASAAGPGVPCPGQLGRPGRGAPGALQAR